MKRIWIAFVRKRLRTIRLHACSKKQTEKAASEVVSVLSSFWHVLQRVKNLPDKLSPVPRDQKIAKNVSHPYDSETFQEKHLEKELYGGPLS